MVSGPLIKVSLLLWYLLQSGCCKIIYTLYKSEGFGFLDPFLRLFSIYILYVYSQLYL